MCGDVVVGVVLVAVKAVVSEGKRDTCKNRSLFVLNTKKCRRTCIRFVVLSSERVPLQDFLPEVDRLDPGIESRIPFGFSLRRILCSFQ